MIFSCEKNILLEALNKASKAVLTKSTITSLEGLLICAEDNNKITISGYNLNIGIKAELYASVKEKGSIILKSKIFCDIIRKAPDSMIYIETNENLMANIKCEKSVFNIKGQDPSEFPDMPETLKESSIGIKSDKLKNMITQTIFAVSDNESKPILTGCLFEIENNEIKIVAVDGHRLALKKEICEFNSTEKISFVVPQNSLKEIVRLINSDDITINIYSNKKNITFEIDDTTLVSRLLEGQFINYDVAIPKNSEINVILIKNDFISSIERTSLMISENYKTPIKMNLKNDVLKLSCTTSIGTSYDECILEGNVSDLEIGFNHRYLLDALKASSCEKVKLMFSGELSPLTIVSEKDEDDNFIYVILPLRLK